MHISKLTSLFGSRFFRENLIVLVVSNLTNLFMYLGQMILSRSLYKNDFSIFNSLLNLTNIVFSFYNVISFSTVKTITNLPTVEERRGFSHLMLKYVSLLAALSTLGLLIASGEISNFLNLHSRMSIFICISVIFILVIQAFFSGLVQGVGEYIHLSIGMFLQSLSRFLGFLAVSWLSLSYNSALWAVLYSVLVTLLYYAFSVRKLLCGASIHVKKGTFKMMGLNAVNILFMSVLVALITNTDLIIVRHFFSGEEAGLFSVAALIGRLSYYLPGLIIYIFFAEVAKNDSAKKSSLQSLLITGGLTTLTGAIYVVFIGLFPKFFITLLFGANYVGSEYLTIVISVTMAIFSLTNILFNFFTARAVSLNLYPSYGLFVLTVGLIFAFFHNTPTQIALVLLAGIASIFIVNVILACIIYRKEIRTLFINVKTTTPQQ